MILRNDHLKSRGVFIWVYALNISGWPSHQLERLSFFFFKKKQTWTGSRSQIVGFIFIYWRSCNKFVIEKDTLAAKKQNMLKCKWW